MLQNPRKTLGLKKNMVYKVPPGGGGGGEVNHIQPVAYILNFIIIIHFIITNFYFFHPNHVKLNIVWL